MLVRVISTEFKLIFIVFITLLSSVGRSSCQTTLSGYRAEMVRISLNQPPPQVIINKTPFPLFFLRTPQEYMFNKLVNMQGIHMAGTKVLEIGYGHPSILMALSFVNNDLELFGVETFSPRQEWLNWPQLRASKIKLFSTGAKNVLEENLFNYIFAVDVFKLKQKVGFGTALAEDSSSIKEKLREAFDSLMPNGKLLIVNDFDLDIALSYEEVSSLGFAINKWAESIDYLLYTIHDVRNLKEIRNIRGANFGIYKFYEFTKK
ncbi:MAG: hypothetical protein H6625_08295 [Bdellovibrionaceae bacterium]|nr:hypothetical protein [Pseudobdellovibrionaceae bacterium]